MLVAKQKRSENIVEYILYMWQLEDYIRACNFDIDIIMSRFSEPAHTLLEIRQWYLALVSAMKHEKIEESGHLMQLKELVQDLSMLNIKLLQKPDEKKYQEVFNKALPNIAEIIEKSDGAIKNEIDACLTGVYGLLLYRIQKKTLTKGTEEAIESFTKALAFLAFKYREFEKGELVF